MTSETIRNRRVAGARAGTIALLVTLVIIVTVAAAVWAAGKVPITYSASCMVAIVEAAYPRVTPERLAAALEGRQFYSTFDASSQRSLRASAVGDDIIELTVVANSANDAMSAVNAAASSARKFLRKWAKSDNGGAGATVVARVAGLAGSAREVDPTAAGDAAYEAVASVVYETNDREASKQVVRQLAVQSLEADRNLLDGFGAVEYSIGVPERFYGDGAPEDSPVIMVGANAATSQDALGAAQRVIDELSSTTVDVQDRLGAPPRYQIVVMNEPQIVDRQSVGRVRGVVAVILVGAFVVFALVWRLTSHARRWRPST